MHGMSIKIKYKKLYFIDIDWLYNHLRYGVVGNVDSSVGIVTSLPQTTRDLI